MYIFAAAGRPNEVREKFNASLGNAAGLDMTYVTQLVHSLINQRTDADMLKVSVRFDGRNITMEVNGA